MPLFIFKCSKCEKIIEKFFHSSGKIKNVMCEECDEKCERQFSTFSNRVWLDAKALYNEKIKPDAERIVDKMSKGSDKDFFDIYGDK